MFAQAQAQPSQPAPSNYHRPPFPPPSSQVAPHYSNHLNPVRQLHAPKSPLYRPAVLRPTEQPTRPPSATPSTSPKSFHSSLSGESKQEHFVPRNPTVYNDIGSEHGEEDDVFDVNTIVESEDGEEGGRLTGPPTKGHWKVRGPYMSALPYGVLLSWPALLTRSVLPPCRRITNHQHANLPNVFQSSVSILGAIIAGNAATYSAANTPITSSR